MRINSEKSTIGDLLKDGKTYAVPIFQRSYAWREQEIKEFWEDLVDLYENRDDNYFVGSMVFTPHEEKNKIKILDGQQRFATFLLLLSALRDILNQTDFERASKWIESIDRIIFFTDEVTCLRNPKLELNREDRIFFEKITIDRNISEVKYNSHKLIRDAYSLFKKEINKKTKEDGEKFIEGILDVILNKLLMIKIEVDSDVNANMIFETLNDRGLELSVADLVKNYIFSISGSHLGIVMQNWKDIVDQVGDHNVTKFLRHFWISSSELVRKKEEVYKKLKNKVKESDVKNFMEQLAKESAIYANLNAPTHEFWGDSKIESMIEELNMLKVEQIYILLLALYNHFYNQKDTFKNLLQVLIDFTFRYNTICGLDPKELEALYHRLSIKVRKNGIDENKVIEEIRKKSPSKDKLISSFKDIEIKNTKLARYILLKINNYLFLKVGRKEVTTNISEVNLEHIIPKKLNKDWKKFFEENDVNEEELIYRLGNMTVLYKEYNRKIANKFFDKKKVMYKKSELPLNEKLKKYKKFGSNEVKVRQQEMAEIAEDLWKV